MSAGRRAQTALQRDLPAREVLARLAQVLALAWPSPIVTCSPCALTCSCMTIVSAPGGTTPPVMMRTACPAASVPRYGAPAKASCRRPSSVTSPSLFKSAIAHRVAVHRGVVVRGYVERRDDVLGEHPPQRSAHVHALDGRDGCEEARDDFARLVDRHRIGIVIVGAGERRRIRQRLIHTRSRGVGLMPEFRQEAFAPPGTRTLVRVADPQQPVSRAESRVPASAHARPVPAERE